MNLLRFKDGEEQAWADWKAKNTDAYGACIFRYAERWAGLMEDEIDKTGEISKEMCEQTSHDADTEGITGFMHGAAKQSLITCWKYGEELKEVMGAHNPAILTMVVEP